MKAVISKIQSSWSKREGASKDDLLQAETALHIVFPRDYKVFLKWSNGGEGEIGNLFLSLWSTNEVVTLGKDYQIAKYIPGIVAIGTDGGGKAYCLDYRTDVDNPKMVRLPLGDIDPESVHVLADDFQRWLEKSLDAT